MSCCNFVHGRSEVSDLQANVDQAELSFPSLTLAPHNRQETLQLGSHAESCCVPGVR